MASAKAKAGAVAAARESCPRCGDGVLYVVADYDEGQALACLHCGHRESRLKPGYVVDAPGDAARKVGEE